jgi:hypothetical protein
LSTPEHSREGFPQSTPDVVMAFSKLVMGHFLFTDSDSCIVLKRSHVAEYIHTYNSTKHNTYNIDHVQNTLLIQGLC